MEYDGGAMDPDGAEVDPDEELFMGYFLCGRNSYYFTDQQKELMMADLLSSGRSHLRVTNPTNTQQITAKPTLTTPENAATTPDYRNVLLGWTEVAGADRYLIEVSQAPNFPANGLQSFFSENNSHHPPQPGTGPALLLAGQTFQQLLYL